VPNVIKNKTPLLKGKKAFNEIPLQNLNVGNMSENGSDSGIEDLGESCSDVLTDETVEEPSKIKRKRKQKDFADYHTGIEMNLAIKSTTWKPMPPLSNKKSSPRKRKTQSLDSNSSTSESPQKKSKIEQPCEKENLTVAKRGCKKVGSSKLNKDVEPDSKQSHSAATPVNKRKIRLKIRGQERNFTEIKDTKEETLQEKEEKKTKIHDQSQSVEIKVELSGIITIPTNISVVDEEKVSRIKRDEKDVYCSLCEETHGELISCCGQCFRYFHFDCLGLGCKPKNDFICDECQTGQHTCFLCKEPGELFKCAQITCGKFYHSGCMDKLQVDRKEKVPTRFFCPHHSCKLCVKTKDSTLGSSAPLKSNSKLVKCIRCPTAYHQKSCFIAGCLVLTSHYMICDQHYEAVKSKKHNHVNVTWCFVCSHGGSLVCCDTCPASFHPECTDELKGIPEGAWKCKDCREHNKPKYGEIVWVKFGVYRFVMIA